MSTEENPDVPAAGLAVDRVSWSIGDRKSVV